MAFYPEEFEKALEVINSKCIVQFEETSSFNDLCENATYSNDDASLIIFFPNLYGRSAENEEEVTSFCVAYEVYESGLTYLKNGFDSEAMSLEEVITAVNTLVIKEGFDHV